MRLRGLKRLGEKETRRLWAVIFAGKMLGVIGALGVLTALSWYFRSPAGAALGQGDRYLAAAAGLLFILGRVAFAVEPTASASAAE
jgi:hypothetical protein